MKIKYDIKKLENIIRDIQIVMRFSVSVMDLDMKPLVIGNNCDEFCQRILSTPEGKKRCACADISLSERCTKTARPVSHICHAGLLDTAVPIIKQETVVGYIFIGRIRPIPEPIGISERLVWLGDSREEIEERYGKLTYFTAEQLSSVINLISNIIFDSAVEIIYDDFMEIAENYIEKNLDKDITVSSLCKSLFVSKNKLYEAFRRVHGTTPNDYVWQKRIQKAKEILSSTDKGIAEISSEVGIKNYTYFFRTFKSKTGLSPKDYRKINSEEA